jgi:hypothetical protein
MSDRPIELQPILTEVRHRWTMRAVLRAWTLAATASALFVLAGVAATWLVARDGLPLVFTASVVALTVIGSLTWTLWPIHRPPTNPQIARLIEERFAGLDDVVVTAVDVSRRSEVPLRMREAFAGHAAQALKILDLDVVVSRESIRRSAFRAAAATAALAVSVAVFTPALSD